MFRCIKYSYTDGSPARRRLDIKDCSIRYSRPGGLTSTTINLANVRGATYGPRTTTFEKVRECIPWLVLSLITADRTYDFEFKNLPGLKRFVAFLLAIGSELDCGMVIPRVEDIDRGLELMRLHASAAALGMFRNPRWKNWFDNKSRKWKIVKYGGRDASDRNDEGSCCICTEEYDCSDFVCELTCGHIFHITCIGQWFERSLTCPLCRVSMS